MSSSKNILKRLKGKSPKTLAVRGMQELRLAVMAATGGWRRLEKSIDRHFSAARVEKYIEKGFRGIILDKTAPEALALTFREGLIDRALLQEQGAAVRARDFKILSYVVSRNGDFPWSTDWRFNHEYPPRDFRRYDHHAARDTPYDVKYPWELSRLSFLLPLMQKAIIETSVGGGQGQIEEVFATLTDFAAKNPFAGSVNWSPMEVSMRGITLVLLLEMAMLARVSPDKIGLLLKMLARHGEFLWRTVEYTDNRGNHYAANIVALLLIGCALAGDYNPCTKWQLYAAEHIEDEILRQYLPDGVNFEKSTGYHILVTELFLLARIVMNRQRLEIGDEAVRRLHEAALFTATALRQDGLIPVIGDADDARVFVFDLNPARDPAPLLSLASVLFEDPELKGALRGKRISPALPWILGLTGVERYLHLPSSGFSGGRYFQDGGFMIVRKDSGYLFFDAGEVGQNGVGGHGHNDILSFELGLEGHPLIVDAGCPTYTGDPRARKLFRSTAWHNGLVIDNTEVADIEGPFRIADQAKPHSVSYAEKFGLYILKGGHSGYARLQSPVDHVREISFDPFAKKLVCEDKITASARHRADRYLHFAAGVLLQLSGKDVIATLHQHRFRISFDVYSTAEIVMGRVSDGYGHTAEAYFLKLSTEISASAVLRMQIEKA